MKKSKTRIYIKKQISSNLLIYIKDKQHHFLKNVMRVKINDCVRIFDGQTGEWDSKVLSINRDSIVLRVVKKIKDFPDKSSDIWLIFSPIKLQRINIVIQKATELGVKKIIPCLTDYANIRSINLNNLKKNAIEAAEQSERLDIPIIEKIVNLEALLKSWPNDRYLIYCDEKNKNDKNIIKSIQEIKDKNHKKWSVIVGPEGGFSDSEKKLMLNNKNVISVSLGKRLLRSDTAITVSLFCIQELVN